MKPACYRRVVPGLAVLAGTRVLLAGERGQGKLGAFSAMIGTGAILALAISITRAGATGWAAPATVTSLAPPQSCSRSSWPSGRAARIPCCHCSYSANMPGVFAVSSGLGASAIATTAVHGVPRERAGVASAVVNMAQQIGAALGIAAMTAISTAVSDARIPEAASKVHEASADSATVTRAAEALAAGNSSAFLAGAALLLTAAVNTRMVQKSAGSHAH